MGFLPASIDAVIPGTGEIRSSSPARRGRVALLSCAALVEVVALAPPVGDLARRYVTGEVAQFALLAIVVPALAVFGAPFGGRSRSRAAAGEDVGRGSRLAEDAARVSAGRRHHRSPLRSAGFLVLYCVTTIAWRVPGSVDALGRNAGLSLLEAVTVFIAGALFWLEIVPSPPFVPRSPYPSRIALIAVAMWTNWIIAYLLGLSHAPWFTAFHHHRGVGLSLSADQQLAAGVLWVVSAAAFLPVVFVTLMTWLGDGEDPDDELRQLVRTERRHASWKSRVGGGGRTAPGGLGPAESPGL